MPSVLKHFAQHWAGGGGVDDCSFQALLQLCQISPPLGFWVLSNLFLFPNQRRRHWVKYLGYCMPGLSPLGLNIDWCINILYNKQYNGPFSKFQNPQVYYPNCSRDHDVMCNMWSHSLTVFHNLGLTQVIGKNDAWKRLRQVIISWLFISTVRPLLPDIQNDCES